ncbi:hypothetical protein [Pseudomonas denitrificans (nom. rej.)]|uniref:Permuted papain-like amidase YaeF/Yiix C92 family enzyme n=1 Tax=Pseudomonas denitrificans TaxID=43306 RepID=A0A9X7MX62_PSEDE|nr:hypothetical protein [Pseudomonas denitrificans (nom. rej.)]QEY70721.1 hypothetical protein F1C79_03110 [Pseudomonas denitrificans (nom. rej.)]
MIQRKTSTLAAVPGDILLLSGKSKSRALNLGYQTITRGSRARYTHVALVISPFRVIHAIPGEGVEIRAWREIRDLYYTHESSVARSQGLSDTSRDKLLARAQYYFGQRYSLRALHSPSEKFNDQQGIVCSQFVAQVFHDAGIQCSSGGVRNCLPSDIHAQTQDSSNWIRIPLSDYLFDPAVSSARNCIGESMDLLFELDGHTARSIKESFWISQASFAMEAAIESMAAAVEAGCMEISDISYFSDFSNDALSPRHLAAVWMHHFSTSKSPAIFMHEDGVQPDHRRRLFTRTCDAIGTAASTAFDEMDMMTRLFGDWLEKSKQGAVETQSSELARQLLELNESLVERAAALDRALGWQENLSCELGLDLPEIYKSGIYGCKEELDIASRCLINISSFACARNAWSKMRSSVLAQAENIYSLIVQEI